MAYLEEFQERIFRKDFTKVLQLWEEYSNNDVADADEFAKILKMIKESELAGSFGKYAETALPLWSKIDDPEGSFRVLSYILDLQTTNSPVLAELAMKVLDERYAGHKFYKQKIRLVGLRTMENFQGAIHNFELLNHMDSGKFVYHTGGWGTGEIVEISLIREHVVIEFENVTGRRDMTFQNAFKNLIPLSDEHFLARRFGDPDRLEEEARKDSVGVIRMMLQDLGPKTAAEIKDELAEWVIPEETWTKWWQSARQKLKKDTQIGTPRKLSEPFTLHEQELSHEERMQKEILVRGDQQGVIQTTYNYVRDFPQILKDEDAKNSIREKMLALFNADDVTPGQKLQLAIFLENQLDFKPENESVKDLILGFDNLIATVDSMEILAFQKRALVAICKWRDDWVELFLKFLFHLPQNTLRDFVLRELNHEETLYLLHEKVTELLNQPLSHPDIFVWYFQKVVSSKEIPYGNKEGQLAFMEAFLILYSKLESNPKHRDLVKKMYNLISKKRYELIRNVIEGCSIEYIKEFLLLVTKCQSLSDHDIKILHSLAEVVHPSLAKGKKKSSEDDGVIWTTETGYEKTRNRIEHLGTVEIIEVAKEIESARQLGDLRENAEYKAALERRSRLQTELKSLSDQFGRARIITTDDINGEEVSIGSVIEVVDPKGSTEKYTILGPWDADPEKNVLSIQSLLAQTMLGCRKGESFTFKENEFKVKAIESIFQSKG